MFPSTNNGFNNDQYSILHRPFFNDIITNPKQDQDSSSFFFHFSSPFLHYESALEDDRDVFLQQHHDLLFHHQQPLRADHNSSSSEIFLNMVDSSQNDDILTKDCKIKSHNINGSSQQIPRKRASKRDRHSKISTAKGMRDRRMRLSLDVARNFFGLQDMLGYDKASKTVEWLLIQAKQEIRKLEKGLPGQMVNNSCVSVGAKSTSSTSDCTDVASGLDEAAITKKPNISKPKPSIKGKKIQQSTRKISLGPRARDLRDKARARARKRTIEKRTQKLNESKPSDDDHDLNQLGSWSSFETGEESGTHSHDMNHSLKVLAEVEGPSSHEQHEHLGSQEAMIDDPLANMGKWSPFSSIFGCLNNIGTPQEHQLPDFQSFSKP